MGVGKDVVLITEQDMEGFRELYDIAVAKEKETFFFKGHEVLTAYAKYVIEYYDSKFEKNDNS